MLRDVIAIVLNAYLLVVIARMIISWVQVFAPQWRPKGVVLILANAVFWLTDPPLRWIGKYVKPLRLGDMMLDMAFVVLVLAISVLQWLNVFFIRI